ncbi:MAG: outer membrane protein assembly factor BamE [Rhodovarius sp.]|nr:outer membrane protein assembly factor BamE [Rhodovarius sp.]
MPLPLLLVLGACHYLPPLPERPREVFDSPRVLRGHAVAPEELAQITPGVTRREDVRALLGSPSHTGTFSDDTWYYISSYTRQRPGRQLSVTDQQVVVVRFDARGTVREVRRIGEEEARNIAFVERETPVPGNERTLLQALFGNIGRLGPGNVAPASPGVSATGR